MTAVDLPRVERVLREAVAPGCPGCNEDALKRTAKALGETGLSTAQAAKALRDFAIPARHLFCEAAPLAPYVGGYRSAPTLLPPPLPPPRAAWWRRLWSWLARREWVPT